jgi:Ca2+-binding RTX toxin-like protein
MTTVEAGAIARPRDSEESGAAIPDQPVLPPPTGGTPPILPPDLLMAEAEPGPVGAPPRPDTQPVSAEAPATEAPSGPSDRAALAADLTPADPHSHMTVPQAEKASSGALYHAWTEPVAQVEPHPTHHAAPDDLLVPWQQDELLLSGHPAWPRMDPGFSSTASDYGLPSSAGGDMAAPAGLAVGADTFTIGTDIFAAAFAAMKTGGMSMLDNSLTLAYLGAKAGISGLAAQSFGDQMASLTDGQFVTIDATSKDGDGAALLHQLESIGLQAGSSFAGIASGFLAVSQIGALTGVADLAFASESRIFSDAGKVTSQGDHAMLSDSARSTYAVDGTGITVGVLSDSFNTSGNADTMATDIANGDLPAATTVLTDHAAGTDEGRAMAQIVHDVAPGASILFETAFNGMASFANSIIDLAAHGAKVIVDDVTYFAETAYQDGVIAQAVNQVVANGAVYFSAAANDGRNGFEAVYQDSGAAASLAHGDAALAKLTTTGNTYMLPLTLLSGASAVISLQWSQPAASVSPGHGSQVDLDLFVVNSSNTIIKQSSAANLNGDPIELLQLTNSGASSLTYYVEVGFDKANSGAGVTPGDFKLMAMDNGSGASFGASTLNTNDGTISGHAAAAGAIAVGAAYYGNTPAYGVSPAVLEPYSSNGPTLITYDTAGNALATPVTRSGPAIVAPDGADTSFFYPGDNPDGNSYPNFFGTSAAAPHAAAVAALMLQANSALNAADIRNLMQDSALDMDDSSTAGFDTGFDNATGAGLLQANLAVGYASTLTLTATSAKTVLLGTHLNDTFIGAAGSHTFDGGGGLDKLSYANASSAVTVNLATGTAANGFGGTDTFKNFESFVGGSGNDTFVGTAGSFSFDGGTGTGDKLDYSSATAAVTINIATGTATNGFGGTDTFKNIETFVTGSGNDSFIGGPGSHSFDAGAGTDKLDYSGAVSAVTINLATGSAANGFGGTDTFKNFESFVGGSGNDAFTGAAGSYAFDGGAGLADKLDYSGASSAVTINIATGIAANGFGGSDTFSNIESFVGGSGSDTFVGAAGSYAFDGGSGGTDKLDYSGAAAVVTINIGTGAAANGFGGADTFKNIETFLGGGGNDTFIGGAGSYAFDGGAGLDKLDYSGTPGAVTVNLGTGTATNGFGGSDTFKNVEAFTGGAGSDTFVGAAGSYSLDGGASIDKLDYSAAPGAVTIDLVGGTAVNGFGGTDQIKNFETLVSGGGNDTFLGGPGSHSFDGGAGFDKLDYSGASAAVVLDVSAGTASNGFGGTDTFKNFESYVGGSGNDSLTGGSGADVLNGGLGADAMSGGAGNDTYYVDNPGDTVIEASGGGIDTVNSTVSTVLASYVENLNLLGPGDINGTGNTLNNTIIGNSGINILNGGSGNDILDGGAGADQMIGGAGNDTYYVDNTGDTITELSGGGSDQVFSSVTYALSDFVEKLTLTGTADIDATGNVLGNTLIGNAGVNTLDGGAGNDTLDGGAGADKMIGGTGNDTYYVDNTGDTVVEGTGAGTDLVYSSVTFALSDNVENLTLTGTLDINGTGNVLGNLITGNSGANTLTGNEGNDILDGGAGADQMIGGTGNDTYVVDNVGDTVTEGLNAGTDIIKSSVDFALGDNVENLTLTGTADLAGTGNALNNAIAGNAGNNVLTGNGGNDILNGNAGADQMTGGAGNDTYYVDNAGDVVTEAVNGGTDTVISTITYALTDNVENLTLSGTADIDGTGNILNNVLTGNAGVNTLDGGDGNDTLNGGAGADHLIGGAGNDIYVVDNVGDTVTELAKGGTDAVQSSVTYTLSDNVENLTLTGSGNIDGSGNGLDNVLTGNAGANTLDGGDGNDTLNGGAGADQLIGGAGNDIYVVDNAGDTVTEGSNGGIDTVKSSVSFVLGDNVENLTLTGSTAIDGTGNALNNTIIGNTGANVLDGGAGDDVLTGGSGRDTFHFDSLADAGTGLDKVTDFAKGATGDILNVHDLLDTFAGYDGSNAFSGGFLNFKASGTDTIVQVDADGGGNAYQTLVTLQHVTLTQADTQNYVV